MSYTTFFFQNADWPFLGLQRIFTKLGLCSGKMQFVPTAVRQMRK